MVELPLVFDEQFFEQLTEDVLRLGQLQRQEEETIRGEIVELGSDVGNLAAPPGRSLVHRRSDMNRWRAIFDVYVGAEVFFSTHELDHGARTAEGALEKLRWFEAEVARQGLIGQFKLRESAQAYARFVRVNVTLLKCMRFQEINRLAVAKILKSECRNR